MCLIYLLGERAPVWRADVRGALYGLGREETEGFGRQCLLAKRLAERGVRFIEVNQGGWDHHRNLRESLTASCAAVDRPIAALLVDLERSGLLEDTLVLWGGEFGRTPKINKSGARDHWPHCFSALMAGGGIPGDPHPDGSDGLRRPPGAAGGDRA